MRNPENIAVESRRRMRRSVLPLVFVLLPAAAAARSLESSALALSAGAFNVSKSEKQVEAGIELRTPLPLWGLAVAAGLYATPDRSVWIFGGLRRDFSLGRGWLVTPAFGISLYSQGEGKDLGGPVEFRSALELAYEWANRTRLALAFYHLSNAGLYDHNPGSNSLILTYSFPLKRPSPDEP